MLAIKFISPVLDEEGAHENLEKKKETAETFGTLPLDGSCVVF